MILSNRKRGRPTVASKRLGLGREDQLLIKNRRLKTELDIEISHSPKQFPNRKNGSLKEVPVNATIKAC